VNSGKNNDSGNKLIMVVGGSDYQIPIVKKINMMGYKTLVVNLYENSPAFKFANYSEVVDILDKAKCLLIARKYKINAILSDQTDIAMPTVAYVAEQLKLPSLGSNCAALYTNKALMRDFNKINNISNPEYLLCHSLSDVQGFFEDLNHPVIIKPLDSNSSRGVFKINQKEELLQKFDESLSYSKVEKAVLAERYINGTEFTVDGIKYGNKHITLAISEKKHYEHNINIAYELFFSNYSEDYDYDYLRCENNRYVELTNLPDGCLTHAEYKYENGKYYLIEIGARGGGAFVSSEIVPLMSGVDHYEYIINASLGIPNKNIVIDKSIKHRCAALYFFNTPGDGGFVKEVKGLKYMEDSKNVNMFSLNFKIGDKIEKPNSDAARVGFYIAHADTRKELIEIMEQVNICFKILYK
jgi:biotin carboxylase